MANRYTMLLAEEVPDRGPDWWIFYPVGGSYIHDEIKRLPGGSRFLKKQAQSELERMNAASQRW